MKKIVLILIVSIFVFSCKQESKDPNAKLNVVTTTTMITDLVKNIGGDLITVEGLMGSGVDPHLYKASEGDVTKLVNADVIFYNGLHLEGKLVEVFEKMGNQNMKTIAVGEVLNKSTLIGSDYFASNYDPHIWFSINNWKQVTTFTIEKLKELDPKNAEAFETNGKAYLEKLNTLEAKLKSTIEFWRRIRIQCGRFTRFIYCYRSWCSGCSKASNLYYRKQGKSNFCGNLSS